MKIINNWQNITRHPWSCAILGARGSGKSCLSYYLAEYAHKKYSLPVVVLGLPVEKQSLLPESYTIVGSPGDIPPSCIVVIDEGALLFNARRSMNKQNLKMDEVLSLSRQRNQTIIMATHNLRKLDVALVSDLDAICFKQPSFLHSRFERTEIREFTKEADAELKKVDEKDRQAATYVISQNFVGIVTNGMPSFWSDELSCGYANLATFEEPSIKSPVEKKIRELRTFVQRHACLTSPKHTIEKWAKLVSAIKQCPCHKDRPHCPCPEAAKELQLHGECDCGFFMDEETYNAEVEYMRKRGKYPV